MSKYTFFQVIRGIECDVTIHDFEWSPDINVFGGTDVEAVDMEGRQVELSDAEIDQLNVTAVERYAGDSSELD